MWVLKCAPRSSKKGNDFGQLEHLKLKGFKIKIISVFCRDQSVFRGSYYGTKHKSNGTEPINSIRNHSNGLRTTAMAPNTSAMAPSTTAMMPSTTATTPSTTAMIPSTTATTEHLQQRQQTQQQRQEQQLRFKQQRPGTRRRRVKQPASCTARQALISHFRRRYNVLCEPRTTVPCSIN